jgi:hypothetical protein
MSWIFLIGYFVLFFAFIGGLLAWRRHTRSDRKPFPDDLRLLRAPGESALRTLTHLNDRLFHLFIGAFAIPVVISGVLLAITTQLEPGWQPLGLGLTLVALLVSLFCVARIIAGTFEETRNRDLGYFGERIVGEALDPLKAQGFRVFHDVPAGDDSHPFNLDHVVVGPTGVFAIETKTRRKRRGASRPGYAEHEIIYDGQVLAYPWGEDTHGLAQTLRQAAWLRAWLHDLLGAEIPVHPILTFPGWMVISRAPGAVTVLNPKQLPAALTQRGPANLTATQIDLIARQLEARCRDVAF